MNKKKIHEALDLMNSMILSGEAHSDLSKTAFEVAIKELKNNEQNLSHEIFRMFEFIARASGGGVGDKFNLRVISGPMPGLVNITHEDSGKKCELRVSYSGNSYEVEDLSVEIKKRRLTIR